MALLTEEKLEEIANKALIDLTECPPKETFYKNIIKSACLDVALIVVKSEIDSKK